MNMIRNCPIITKDIKNTEFSWGPAIGCVKGTMARQMSLKVKVENSSIPVCIMQKYKNITLAVDIMKMAGIQFLIPISRHIKFG